MRAAGPIEERDRKSTPPIPPGDILLGKYRVERVVGEGSMGTIFAARHVESGEVFALKVLSAKALASSQATPRFLREAHALALLRGPHVATVHEIARLPSGAPCMVMEYLHGSDLQEILARGLPRLSDALEWMIQACEGVAQAHASDIVHRDIKPANLFVSPLPDGRSQVRVLDFGIAKLVERDSPFDHELTQVGMVFGSPSYMSPEQMRQTKDVDSRTDIWSLGVVLYEMLAGVVPFSPVAGAMDLAFRVAAEAPARPLALRPDLPPALDVAVMRCLEKRPANRYSTALELAEVLRGVLATLGPDARRSSAPPAVASLSASGAVPAAPGSFGGGVPAGALSASGEFPAGPVSVGGGAPPGPVSVDGGMPPGPLSLSGEFPAGPVSARGGMPPGPLSLSGEFPAGPVSVSGGGIPPGPLSLSGEFPAGPLSLSGGIPPGPLSLSAAPEKRGAPRWIFAAAALAVVLVAGVCGLFLWAPDPAPGTAGTAQAVSSTPAESPPPTSAAASAESEPAASAESEPAASAESEPVASAEAPVSATAPAPSAPPRPVSLPPRPPPTRPKLSYNACFTTADCRRGKRCIQGWCK